ncbi:hypothetical protein HYH39_06660 [Clostridium botulinum]|nr:hypothetical protein KU40_04675 [Clostridium botulinum]MBY6778621.1 hypothetical protein [Clostridium botulinum]MBY6851800.1 hypothetical protein [Clostridium botulinum]
MKLYKGLKSLNRIDDFEIVSKNEYALAKLKDGYNNRQINDEWDYISKGYNFAFKCVDMYYSVDYLDRVLEV